jgi:hypothetical protein
LERKYGTNIIKDGLQKLAEEEAFEMCNYSSVEGV